jgi:hypothetical protein
MTTNEAAALNTANFRSALLDLDVDGADNDVPEAIIRAAVKALRTLDEIETGGRVPRGGLNAVAHCAAYLTR